MARLRASLRDPALRQRIASSLVLAIVAVGAAMLGGWWFAALVLIAVAIMSVEWAQLAAAESRWRGFATAIACGPALAIVVLMAGLPGLAALVLALGALGVAALAALLGWCEPTRAAGGVLYVGVPTVALVWLRGSSDAGLHHLLWLLLVIAATDTCAYLVGRIVGGPRLAPRISPGKTWAGLVGGVAGASLLGAVAGQILGVGFALCAVVGAGLAVIGQAGDLFESFLKRRAGVKDSGHLIPGHGGLLDRIDGLVFAAPTFAALVWAGLHAGIQP
ncbi:MAG: phosphatidate cytidylyltransferase [Geminicoccaceae bacterium]